ncbi:hypothetical protein HDU76_004819, partial [Blyttiomyces sp. JEL0837]
SWDTTVRYLVHTGDYEVCVFDNRGAGNSTQPAPGYKMKDMAIDAYELLQQLAWIGNGQKIFVAGVSMGGMILLELVLYAPKDTFAGIAFLSTHPGRSLPPLKTVWAYLSTGRNLETATELQKAEFVAKLVMPEKWMSSPPALEPLRKQFKTNREMFLTSLVSHAKSRNPQTELGRKGQAMAIQWHHVSKERLAEIGKLDAKIKVFTGTEDILVRPKNSHYIAKYIPAPLQVYPGVGHAVMIENPDVFHRDLITLFQSSSSFIPSANSLDIPTAEKMWAANAAASTATVTEEVVEVGEATAVEADVEIRKEIVMVAEGETETNDVEEVVAVAQVETVESVEKSNVAVAV